MAEDKDKDQTKDQPKKRKARVLADLEHGGRKYKCNEVLEADAADIKALRETGQIDDHPSAVAYSERQIAKVKAAAAAKDEE